jgi:LEM3 (ligand-effect modulator 3) family / CDC50 family
VYMYYSLTNFYQNHRRYVKSRDDNQLLGSHRTYSQLSSDCEPFRGISNSSLTGGGVAYAPCGAIANSLFNGTKQC